MITNQNYLIHSAQGHTWVGQFVRQTTATLYLFTNVSKISQTNNDDNWHELAVGNSQAREDASYIHYEVDMNICIAVCAMDWKGDLPKR